jgi:hypothetical protein
MNNTKRFFYNPINGKLSIFNSSHVEYFHNNKGSFESDFDFYIRGIITEEKKILLRVFYPYENIHELCYDELLKKSYSLLSLYLADIKKALYKEGFKDFDFVFNVTNEEVKDILKACFV